MTSTVRPSYPGNSGARSYPFPVDPHSATFRPSLDRHQLNKETMTPTSTTGNRTSTAALQMSPRPVINITTMPQGWPARTGARRHNNTNSARFDFSSKAPPRVRCKPYPPLESIKGEGKELSGGTTDEKTRETSPTLLRSTSQATLHCTLSLRIGTSSLSHGL
jgi:hypothetical protein